MSGYRGIIKNKKGQIGDLVVWIPATLIIIGVIILFVYISLAMSLVKAVHVGDVQTDLGNASSIRLNVKTSIAEQLNAQNKETIDYILKQQNG
jgi:hypothetical protein